MGCVMVAVVVMITLARSFSLPLEESHVFKMRFVVQVTACCCQRRVTLCVALCGHCNDASLMCKCT